MDSKFESGLSQLAIDDHIRMAIEAERDRAAKLHGSVFSSHHEAWAVLLEEMHELGKESDRLQNAMEDLWGMVMHDQDPELLLLRMSGIAKAIKQKLITDAIEYLNKKMKQPFVEKDGERNDI